MDLGTKGHHEVGTDVSSAELAEWLCVSERQIRALAAHGAVIRTGIGRYDLKASVRAYLTFQQKKADDPAVKRQEERRQREHERFMTETAISTGELIPAERFRYATDAVAESAEKTYNKLERTLVNSLFPRGIRDIYFIKNTVAECSEVFSGWMNCALDMINRGATAEEVKIYLFNAHTQPPEGLVDFGTTATRKRRAKKAADAE